MKVTGVLTHDWLRDVIKYLVPLEILTLCRTSKLIRSYVYRCRYPIVNMNYLFEDFRMSNMDIPVDSTICINNLFMLQFGSDITYTFNIIEYTPAMITIDMYNDNIMIHVNRSDSGCYVTDVRCLITRLGQYKYRINYTHYSYCTVGGYDEEDTKEITVNIDMFALMCQPAGVVDRFFNNI